MIGENQDLILQMNWLSLRNNRLKFKTAGKLPIILEEFIEEYNQFSKGKPNDVNMKPVGLANTRISTIYAQKISPITGHYSYRSCCVRCESKVWNNVRGDFRAYLLEILVFASPTGYMLISFGFPLLNWDMFHRFL